MFLKWLQIDEKISAFCCILSIQYDANTVGISDMLLYNFPEAKYLNK